MNNKLRLLVKRFLYRIRGDYITEDLVKMGLKVGNNFLRMHGTILDPSHCWLISIGNNVTMAPRVHVLAHDASTCNILGYAKIGRVSIGDNVFIGAESIILPNVSIGNNVIIGAGSVVTKSVPSGSVYAGNPARYISSYEDYTEKMKKMYEVAPKYDESYTLRNKYITENQKTEMINDLNNRLGFIK